MDFKEKYEICQQVKEAVQFRDYADAHDIEFCREMAEFHGCYSVKGENENLLEFLVSIFHYGRIQGIRQERARRKRGKQSCSKK